MGEAYRGLTIRFAADGTKVMSTLKAMRRAGADVESELRLVNRALKFDGTNQNAIARQFKLMAERAGTAGAEATRLRKQLNLLGDEDFGGVKMKELSRYTKDASTKASLMRERYNAATESLAKLQNEAEALWYSSKKLGNVPNPFIGWHDLPTEDIQRFIKVLHQSGDIGKEQMLRMTGAVKSLRSEFNLTEEELKKLNHIAEYQSAEDKLLQLEAAAKRYRNALRDAALQARETGHEFNLQRANESLERTAAAAKRLKEAMRLDPGSFEAAIGHAKMLEAEMSAVEHETSELRAEIKRLESISGVRELANDAKRLQEEFIATGKRVDTLSEKLGKAKANADALEQDANELKNKLNAAGDTAGEKLRTQVKGAEEAARAAREEANGLQHEFDQAAAAAEKVNAALKVTDNRTQIAANNAKMQAMSQRQAKKSLMSTSAMTSLGMSMYASVYPMAMMGGSYAIMAAQEVDAAYRDMRKTVQGTEADFENLKQKALEFGDTHVTSADQILEFEAMGGQMGILVQDLEAFSTTVANLDVATNIDAEDVAIELGKMASILEISSDEYDNFADSLVRLGNSEPALESDIMAITARFGAMAHIVGMTPDQILAIATAATATGQKAEAAGGALQRLLGGIETKVSGVSDAMRNLDDLTEEDLAEFEGAKDNLEAFANVAGMSAEQFAQAWEHDAAGAFQKFIEGLKKYGDEGGSVQALLYDELGYHNVRDLQLLQGLTNTTQVMSDSLKMSSNAYRGISDQWGAAGDAAREADKKAQGFSGQLQILKNNGQHMADMLGETLLPAMQQLTSLVSDGVKFFENMGDGVKQATLGMVGFGVALGPVLTMWAAGRQAINSFKTSLAEYTSVQATSARMNGSYIMAQAGLGNQYLRNGKAIEANKARMAELAREQSKLNRNTQNGIVTSRSYSREQMKLSKENAKLQRQNRLMSVGATGFGVLKSVGTMAGFAIGAYVLEQIITRLIDAKEKAEDFEAATKGVGSVAETLKTMDDSISDGVKNTADAYGNSAAQAKNLHDKTQQLTSANADFARSTLASLDEMRGSAIMAEYWGKRVVELSSGFDGSSSSLASLKTAIQQYNEVTGSNISIVDEETGRLNASTDAINANTNAYKKSIEARAYMSVAEEAAKNEANLQVQYELTTQKIDDLMKEQKKLQDAGQEGSHEYAVNDTAIKQLLQDKRDIKAQIPEMEKARDVALEMGEARTRDAEKAAEQAEKTYAAERSVEAYSKALRAAGENDDAFEQLGAALEIPAESLEDFAWSLGEAGISTKQLASIGTEAFQRLYQNAGGDLNKLNDEITSIQKGMSLISQSSKLNMGDVTINDDATLNVKNHLLDLQNQQIDGKSFTITDNGTIDAADEEVRALLDELGILGATVANPSVNVWVNGSSELAAIKSQLDNLPRNVLSVVTVLTKKVFEGGIQQASGGINDTLLHAIPAHANGGALSGIVTRATLTNQGWVGEDGAEALLRMGNQTAVVPLTNTRYVRPFAQAVASEMNGGNQNVVHNHYQIGSVSVPEGSGAARAMEMLVHELKMARSA